MAERRDGDAGGSGAGPLPSERRAARTAPEPRAPAVAVVIGGCALWHGDARALLPSLQPDVIVTDPVWPNAPADSVAGCDRPYHLFAEFCDAIPDAVRRLAIILRNDSDPRILAPVPDALPFLQVMSLPYALPSYMGRVLGGTEHVYVFGEHVASAPGRRVIPSWGPKAQPHERPADGHPMSRSLTHMRWLVHWLTDPGETVCDPFMGSGQVGLACVERGRPFVGIEIDERWFALARERIGAAAGEAPVRRVAQAHLFAEGDAA